MAVCPYAFQSKAITHHPSLITLFLDVCLGPGSGGPYMAPDSQRACVNEAGLVVGWQLLTLPIWDAHMPSNLKPIARKEGRCWMSRTRGIVIGEHMALDLKHMTQLSIPRLRRRPRTWLAGSRRGPKLAIALAIWQRVRACRGRSV